MPISIKKAFDLAGTYRNQPACLDAGQAFSPSHRMLKRGFDLCLAIVCLLAFSPLLLVGALAIWLTDGGPVIYRHRRIGRNGVSFDCLKLRTMVRDSDRALAAHLGRSPAACAEWAANRKLRDDPRVLGKVGRALRRASIDELPQLFNVLRGEMSFVGPRPIVSEELEYYGVQSRWYLSVRPGVTGPWQVGGRSDTSYATRVRLDVEYARTPSLWRDMSILLQTPRLFFVGKGAY